MRRSSWAGHAAAARLAQEVASDSRRFGLPDVIPVEAVNSGVAHYVYRLTTAEGRFYLKHRGNHFPNMPDILINPHDMAHEYRALCLLGSRLPDCFPRVIYFDCDRAFMVLSDAMPGEPGEASSLEALLVKNTICQSTLRKWGATLGRIHRAVHLISEPIRRGGDEDFFAMKLRHRFGPKNGAGFEGFAEELIKHSERQIIIGDPSPKNIGVSESGRRVVFYDLEDVHQGCVHFDIGFCLGHIVLHAIGSLQLALLNLRAFIDGYGSEALSQSTLVQAVALGTIRYRLDGAIPYPMGISVADRAALLARLQVVQGMLKSGPASWETLIGELTCGGRREFFD